MTIFYSQKKLDFGPFHDGTLPVVKTLEGCKEINKWIKKGEYYPIIKLLFFRSDDGIELSVYQNKKTLEVQQVYEGQSTPEEEYYLILKGTVPIYHLKADSMVQAYMVPKLVKEGDQVYVPKIIKDAQGLVYSVNHTGGVKALFTGQDIIFLEAPNRIYVYKG